jgi:ribosomal protein S13
VHRRAANFAAGKRCRSYREIAHDKIMPVRGGELRPRNRTDQKIVHVRIVLRASFA